MNALSIEEIQMADHKNSLIMRALRNEETERSTCMVDATSRPLSSRVHGTLRQVWLGALLHPEIATEITLQPL